MAGADGALEVRIGPVPKAFATPLPCNLIHSIAVKCRLQPGFDCRFHVGGGSDHKSSAAQLPRGAWWPSPSTAPNAHSV